MGEPEEEENLSGAFDAEEQQWQAMLKADPGFAAFLDFIDAKTKEERDGNSDLHGHEGR